MMMMTLIVRMMMMTMIKDDSHDAHNDNAMLKTAEDSRVDKVVSWASPSNFLNKFSSSEKLEKWKATDVAYVYNGRTKQNMPM